MRTSLLASVIYTLLALLSSDVYATHAMGANITYECLGNNQYRVTLSFYRDCEGITPLNSATITIYSNSCQTNTSMTVNLLAGYPIEVSPLCPSQLPFSECNPGGTLPGVQEYVYQGVVTLPFACRDWTFGFAEGYRNHSITTLNKPGTTYLYLESVLNNLDFPCNNSSTFTNIPTPFICLNQDYLYNHGAVDADGDSLAYTFINPLGGVGNPVTFLGGYSGTNPISSTPPVSINAFGDIFMHPTALEIGVMAVRVEEYRNGILVGAVTRDIQITVLNCNNNAPTINPITNLTGGVQLGAQSIEVCANTPISFNIPGLDQDVLDNLVMTWNNSITGANFSSTPGTTPITGTFTWTPTNANVGYNSFVVTITDDACPIFGSSALAIDILVRDGTDAGQDEGICAGSGETVQLGVSGGTTHTWRVISGSPNSLSCATCASPVASPSVTTCYEVTSNLPCKPLDTVCVVVDPAFTVNMNSDTVLCSAAPVSLSATPATAGTYSYLWSPPVGLSATNQANVTANPSSSQTYVVEVTAAGGCTVKDSVSIDVASQSFNTNPTASAVSACDGDTVTLFANVTGNSCDIYNAVTIPFSPITPTGLVTTLSLGDEQVSAAIPLGFTFNFYCNDYTDVYISSNGWMSFSSASTTDADWSNDAIPNTNPVNDIIAFAWDDLDPTLGGTIEYFTEGTAPNRMFVLDFNNVAHYACSGCRVTTQVILYESSNTIEIHNTQVDNHGATGSMTQGIESSSGAKGHAVSGRNAATWTATGDAYRFAIGAVPGTYMVSWQSPLGTQVGMGDSINVTPGTPTDYYAVVSDLSGTCTNNGMVNVDVAYVDAGPNHTIFFGDTANIDATYFGPPAMFDCDAYTVSQMPYNWETGTTGTLSMPTNGIVNAITIGFTFDFYCNSYTRVNIAEDGWMTFIRAVGDNTSDPIPNVNSPNAIIAAAWDNLKQINNGNGVSSIYYHRTGTAPNRKFIVTWDQMAHYTLVGGSNIVTTQIVLHETTNIIEINNQRVDSDGGASTVQGIEKVDGRAGLTVPGRNHTAWSVSASNPDSYRFTPPPTSMQYSWTPGLTMNDSTLEDPKASPPIDQWYVLTLNTGTCILQDSMQVLILPLPIQLVDFSAKRVEDFVLLNWETEAETQSDYFVIEKSRDGMIFEDIGVLDAAGNSQVNLTYEYLDTDPFIGENYYRLKMVDQDGSFRYSSIETQYFENIDENRIISVYPNPSSGRYYFDLYLAQTAPVWIRIIGMNGKMVHNQRLFFDQPGLHSRQIDLGNLPAGMYLYQIIIDRDRFDGKISLIK